MKKALIVAFSFMLILSITTPTMAKKENEPYFKVDATAYYDAYGYGIGADQRPLVENLTLAGKEEWLGKTGILYDEDYRMIGIYEFRDVGYGQPTGKGKSKLIKGKTLGTIETGECVDIYFKTKAECEKWGRRKVFLQVLNGKG